MEIEINTEYITLGQLLKKLSLVHSGGETKYFLTKSNIYINGTIENRRGKKLYSGDFIEIDGLKYKLREKNI